MSGPTGRGEQSGDHPRDELRLPGQEFAAVIAGDKSVDDALSAAQAATTKAMTEAGYIK